MPERPRSHAFTSYNTEQPAYNEKKMKYLLYAPEICPDTGRPHWQGYVVWKNPRSISAIQKEAKKAGCPYGWLGASLGSFQENLSYIKGPYDDGKGKTKPFNPLWQEHGTQPKQGSRSDLIHLKNELANGTTSVDEIAIDNPMMFHKYGRTLSKIEDITLRKKVRKWMTTGVWYWGATGVGKSHIAFRNFSPDTHYVWKTDNGWQDGYTGQATVIINDFRGAIPYNELLQMVDKWPHYARRRGREPAPFLAREVIVTSSLSPAKIYNRRDAKDSIKQLKRRMTIVNLKGNPQDLLAAIRAAGGVPR